MFPKNFFPVTYFPANHFGPAAIVPGIPDKPETVKEPTNTLKPIPEINILEHRIPEVEYDEKFTERLIDNAINVKPTLQEKIEDEDDIELIIAMIEAYE